MKFFFIKIGLFLMPIILLALVSDFIVTKGLQKTNCYDFKEWNELYAGKINANIVINGSSRAYLHISPAILDSILLTNSYNLGVSGHNFLMQEFKFQEYLRYNKKTEIVIQTLDLFTLNKRKDLFNFEQFLPYLYKSEVRNITSQYEGFQIFDYFVPFYRYKNDDIIKIGVNEFFSISSFKNTFHADLDNKHKGYVGFDREWDSTFDKFKQNNPNGKKYEAMDSNSVELFDNFLEFCKSQNIRVVLVYTPEYIENQSLTINRDEIFKVYNDFAIKYNLTFLDYSKDTISLVKSNFYNSQHLNINGAELFTKKLASDLKNILN